MKTLAESKRMRTTSGKRFSFATRRMLPAYDKGDSLHLNDAGYKAMAESIDLGLLVGKQ